MADEIGTLLGRIAELPDEDFAQLRRRLLNDEQRLTPVQVASLLQCSRKTVMRGIEAGELEASQLAERGVWRIDRAAVDAWMAARSNRRRQRSIEPVSTSRRRRPVDRGQRLSDLLDDAA